MLPTTSKTQAATRRTTQSSRMSQHLWIYARRLLKPSQMDFQCVCRHVARRVNDHASSRPFFMPTIAPFVLCLRYTAWTMLQLLISPKTACVGTCVILARRGLRRTRAACPVRGLHELHFSFCTGAGTHRTTVRPRTTGRGTTQRSSSSWPASSPSHQLPMPPRASRVVGAAYVAGPACLKSARAGRPCVEAP